MIISTTLIQLIVTPALSPLGIGLIRKIKAKLQNRQGASITQPYRDLWKLFHKDEVISKDASWIFKYAPYFVFATTIVVGSCIPYIDSLGRSILAPDMLVIIYTLATGTFFLALAGMDTGGGFGGFGSSREMTISALAEGGLIFSFLTLSIISHTTNLLEMANGINLAYGNFSLPILLAFSGYFIVLLAETSRFPFDNPATHLELTMIHEAMILEYSGKKLALMEWSAANKLFIFAVLGSNLFFPWWIASGASIYSIIQEVIVLFIKLLLIYTSIALLESSIAKFRFFRLPDLLIISYILNIIAIGLINYI